MTQATADISSVEAYDAARRAAATAQGAPVLRFQSAGILGLLPGRSSEQETLYVGAQKREGVVCAPQDGESIAGGLALDRIAAALTPEEGAKPTRIVFLDAAAQTAAVTAFNAARKQADPGDFRAARAYGQLRFAAGLPLNASVSVLTRILAAKYWAPDGVDASSLGAWATAFGLKAGMRRSAIGAELLEYVAGAPADAAAKYESEAIYQEGAGLQAAGFGSMTAAGVAYAAATHSTEATNAVLALDPLLYERNLLSDVLHEVRTTQVSDDAFTAILPEGYATSTGRDVLVLDQKTRQKATMTFNSESVTDRDGVLVREGWFSASRSKVARGLLVARPSTLTLFEPPFLLVTKGGGPKRWATPSAVRRNDVSLRPQVREIPLDILIAGAPGRS